MARTSPREGRTAVRVAWYAWAASMVLIVLAVGMLLVVHYDFPGVPAYDYWRETLVISLTYAMVGLVIGVRRPGHGIGWLFATAGVVGAVQLAAGQYTVAAWAIGLPGRAPAAWLSTEAQRTVLGLFGLLFLLFPTGTLLSRRWRPVARAWVAGLLLAVLIRGLDPAPLEFRPPVENPLAIAGLAPALKLLGAVGIVLLVGGLLGSLVSLVVRLRRARGRERQQVKWFVYTAILSPVAVYFPVWPSLPSGSVLAVLLNPWMIMPMALAVVVAIAIVRHRLYDIDRVINRTLVYGLLTAVLGLSYAASVLLLGQLFGGVTDNPPSWAVAGATLAVAAVFQPARRRIQQAVDRRFNRRRYDAARTIKAFSARLRDEVDLDTLTLELLAVVDQTMQPTRVSVWLRPERPNHGRRPPGPSVDIGTSRSSDALA